MKVLEYADIDTSKVSRQYEKISRYLENDDFRSAEVKKLPEHDFYRAKLDDTNRLIFKIVSYKGVRYALLFEVVLNHAYDKSKFLRGVKIDESKIPFIEQSSIKDKTLQPLVYVNPSEKKFHFLDKTISFDPEQHDVYKAHPPLIIIGPAGSGKTVLTLEKIKRFYGQGIYVTLSPYLAENARNMYYSCHYENDEQEVSFLSFREYLETMRVPEDTEIQYRFFSNWLLRIPPQQRVADAHRLYEEFRGVITGSVVDKPYLSREEYLNLGVRQSIFLDKERELVYTLFEKYLALLKDNNYYDPNILTHKYLKDVKQVYDFVVIDEVQDITNIQIQIVLKSLKSPVNFILCGDSNQIVHPNFFSWSNLKSMLYNSPSMEIQKVMWILQSNFRNSAEVTELSNKLLKIKQKRFGSIDRESTYLMKSLDKKAGEIIFLKDTDKVKHELNRSIRRSARFAVLVMRDEDKEIYRKFFDTPLLFSIHEAKGLEYENVVLLNFISSERSNFLEIIKGVSHKDMEGGIQYMRASDKTDKSIEVYKFFVNSLYVALTRAVQKIYLIESDTGHPLINMLGLKNAMEHTKVEAAQSSTLEWQTEARKLELQGRQEQADEIRRSILKTQPVPWAVYTPGRLMELASQIRTAKDNPQKPRKALFEYALFYDAPNIIEFLNKYGFDKARQIYFIQKEERFFNRSLYEQQKANLAIKYLQKYAGSSYREIIRECELYGVDHRTEFNKTILMMAAITGNINLIQELLTDGTNTELTDNCGLTAWQNVLQQAVLRLRHSGTGLDKKHVPEGMITNASIRSSNLGFASSSFPAIHEILAPSSLSLKINNRLIKIDSSQGEFLLFHIFFVLLPYQFSHLPVHHISLTAVNLSEIVASLPDSVTPEYRKKRSYLSALLSKNEIDSTNTYCKKLFKRTKTGNYILNPGCEIRQKDNWINIYRHTGIETAYHIISDRDDSFHNFIQSITSVNN